MTLLNTSRHINTEVSYRLLVLNDAIIKNNVRLTRLQLTTKQLQRAIMYYVLPNQYKNPNVGFKVYIIFEIIINEYDNKYTLTG
jgi:hypothetical protein